MSAYVSAAYYSDRTAELVRAFEGGGVEAHAPVWSCVRSHRAPAPVRNRYTFFAVLVNAEIGGKQLGRRMKRWFRKVGIAIARDVRHAWEHRAQKRAWWRTGIATQKTQIDPVTKQDHPTMIKGDANHGSTSTLTAYQHSEAEGEHGND